MDSLEGRVRAALRATADEIAPHDIPSLATQSTMSQNDSVDPAAPTGNWRHEGPQPAGRGPAGPRLSRSRSWGWQDWGVPLAAAVAVLAVVAATVGTARIVDSSVGHGAGGTKAGTSAPPYGSVATLTQDLIDQYMTASGPQNTAAAAFMANVEAPAENTIIIDCLAARGFWLPPGTVVFSQTPSRVRGEFIFPDLNTIAKAGTLPGFGLVTKELSPAKFLITKAYQTAFAGCLHSGVIPFGLMNQYGSRLGDPFLFQVRAIQSSAPVRDTIPGLRACASKYGWPRDFAGKNVPLNSFADFVTWEETFINGVQGPTLYESSPLDLYRHYAEIFVECARPTVAVMERLQLAAQRSFLASHRTQLSHLVSLAIAAFNQANRDAARP